jgi:hypothetical protein
MEVTMLLCDAAQAIGGKLYILGGGWTIIFQPHVPVPMSLAIKIDVPWDRSNQSLHFDVQLVDLDGEPVDLGDGPIAASADFEVGRPAGLKPGTPIDVALALPFGMLALGPGQYVWQLEIEGAAVRAPFRVLPGPPAPGA